MVFPRSERPDETDIEASASMLVDLFTEVAIIERLVTRRVQELANKGMGVPRFAILNFFIRGGKTEETLSTLAWVLQESENQLLSHARWLEDQGMIRVIEGKDDQPTRIIFTSAGEEAYREAVTKVAPTFLQALEEFDAPTLIGTRDTLKEIRRTLDNLPDR